MSFLIPLAISAAGAIAGHFFQAPVNFKVENQNSIAKAIWQGKGAQETWQVSQLDAASSLYSTGAGKTDPEAAAILKAIKRIQNGATSGAARAFNWKYSGMGLAFGLVLGLIAKYKLDK